MTSDTRRFYWCLLATTAVAVLLLPLVSLLWPRDTVQAATHHSGIKLVTLVLKPVAVPHPKVRVAAVAKPPKRKPGARTRVSAPAAPSPAPTKAASTHTARVPVRRRLAEAIKPTQTPVPATAPVPKVPTAILPVPVPRDVTPKPEAAAPAGAVAETSTGKPAGSTGAGGDVGRGAASSGGGGTSGGSGQGGGGEPFGVGAGMPGLGGPRHVVYVLDISGSMTSRIDRARDELVHALKGLSPDETFDIVVFSDKAVSFAPALSPATPPQIEGASRFLRAVRVQGGTNMEAAMRAALGFAGVNEIVLITDGVPTLGETDFGKLASDVQKRNKNLARISAVGLLGRNPDGTDDSFEAEGLLRRITRESSGDSRIVLLGTKSP